MRFCYEAFSAVGGREQNEDAHFAGRIGAHEIFVVADGLGGYVGGALAAQAAVEAVVTYYREAAFPDALDAVAVANARVISLCKETNQRMKTTIALADIANSGARLVHVGDSRIYAFRGGELVYLSRDHSAAQLAVLAGRIRPEELRTHEDRNLLIRALGAQEEVRPEERRLSHGEFDALLLCSDGFWGPIPDEILLQTKLSASDCADWLAAMQNYLCDGDNQTAIVARKGD